MKQQEKDEKKRKISKGAASGATAIIFLIIGFQAAVFVLKVLERGDISEPETETETEMKMKTDMAWQSPPEEHFARKGYAPERKRGKPSRKVESFRFNPNRVTLEELVRLGLSEKQAGAILNYREKGGKFRTKADFKKMYTVSDSLYERLEDFIDIPKVELNRADSAELVSLKGIGPYYAAKIIAYRKSLGGFVDIGQLLEINGIDGERFDGLKESVTVDTTLVHHFRLDTASQNTLSSHPYIGKTVAKSIMRLRSIEKIEDSILLKESILDDSQIKKVKKYAIF